MDHTDSLKSLAAERYLLGEMADEERDAFEEHYFDCVDCAADVRNGVKLIAVGNEVGWPAVQTADEPAAAEQATRERPRPLLWLPAAAALAFACILGYQSLVTIPRLESRAAAADQPRLLRAVSLLAAATRGEGVDVASAPSTEHLGLYFDIPSETPHARYRCELRDSADHVRASLQVDAERAKDTILLQPAGKLAAGDYQVVIFGEDAGQSVEVARLPFRVR